jgi:hypothetical protein
MSYILVADSYEEEESVTFFDHFVFQPDSRPFIRHREYGLEPELVLLSPPAEQADDLLIIDAFPRDENQMKILIMMPGCKRYRIEGALFEGHGGIGINSIGFHLNPP